MDTQDTKSIPMAQTRLIMAANIAETQVEDGFEMRSRRFLKPDMVGRGPTRERALDLLMAALLRDDAEEREAACKEGIEAGGDLDAFLMRKQAEKQHQAMSMPEVYEFAKEVHDLPVLMMEWQLPVIIFTDEAWNPSLPIQQHIASAASVFPPDLAYQGSHSVQLLTPAMCRGIAAMFEQGSFPADAEKFGAWKMVGPANLELLPPWKRTPAS